MPNPVKLDPAKEVSGLRWLIVAGALGYIVQGDGHGIAGGIVFGWLMGAVFRFIDRKIEEEDQ